MAPAQKAADRSARAAGKGNRPVGKKGGRGANEAPAAPPAVRKREPTPLDRLKLQVAEDLGLGVKVREEGWAMLTAAESGRVGGILNKRLKEQGLVIGPKGTLLKAN